jgi:acyl-CoA hydrolase
VDVVSYVVHHLVKGSDLNHHGTLYAGRSAEWFVESGFIAASSLLPPQNIVCLKIHGMTFTRPVYPGSIVRYEGKIVYAGRTSLIAYVRATVKDEPMSEGFITFVYVDEKGCACPHGLTVTPTSPEDVVLQERARNLPHERPPDCPAP